PRLINRLCEQGMMMANIEEASSVTEDMMNEVLENSVFLNNEFDYEGAELEPSEPAPFLNSFNQAAVSAQPTKKSPELLDDFFSQLNSNPNPSPVVPLTPPRKVTVDKKPVKAKPKVKAKRSGQNQSTSRQQQPKITRVAKPHTADVRPVNRTKDRQKEERKPAVVSIFAMGMVTSAMIGSAWYYFDQQSPNLLEDNVAIVGSTELMLPEEKQELNTPNRLQTKRSVIEEKEMLEPKPKEKEIHPQVAVVKKVERSTLIQKEKQIQTVKTENFVDNVIEPVQEKIQSEPVNVVVAQVEAKPIAIEDKVAMTTESLFTQEPTEQQLIKRAKQQVINKQLMSPENDNAWSTYEKVLKLNPNNTQAQEGIYQIKEVYMGWAREKINEGNDIHALHYLNKASKISPNDPDILEAFSKIKRTAVEKSKSFNPQLDTRLYRLLDKPEGIPELLAFASEQIVEKNLTKPVSNSAYSIYKLILNRFPDHAQALEGVKKIRGRYISWAKYEIKHGNLSHAEYLYTKALEVSPSDPEILSDLDQLRQTTKPL
ncbi:MAG: hypothetical protein KAG26_02560, partial [Methylococcales bacterium]|nr:hypothetical protein [Methylococcales bacterium]